MAIWRLGDSIFERAAALRLRAAGAVATYGRAAHDALRLMLMLFRLTRMFSAKDVASH